MVRNPLCYGAMVALSELPGWRLFSRVFCQAQSLPMQRPAVTRLCLSGAVFA